MSVKITSDGATKRLAIDYTPSPQAARFLADSCMVSAYMGPLGCGKSTAGAVKAWLYGLAHPGARIAIVRSTYPSLISTTQRTVFDWIVPGVMGEYAKSSRIFYVHTGDGPPAEFTFIALDDRSDVDRVLSLELGGIWIDEIAGGLQLESASLSSEPGMDEDLFHLLVARAGRQKGYPGMTWLTGNPPSPNSWLARAFDYYGVGLPKNTNPDFHLYLGSNEENVKNLEKGYYQKLEKLFGKDTPLAKRFILGQWLEMRATNPFHAAWINYYKDEDLPKDGLYTEIGVDPAISKNDAAAQTAIVVASQSQRDPATKGSIYVRDYVTGHWSVFEQIDQIIKLTRKWNARTVRIEDVAYQRSLGEVLERELRTAGLRPHIDLVKPDGDKLRRANAWSALVEDGTVKLKEEHHVLRSAMLSVPQDKASWDIVDAAGLVISGFPRIYPATSSLAPPSKVAASYATDTRFRVTNLKSFENAINRHRPSLTATASYFNPIGVRR